LPAPPGRLLGRAAAAGVAEHAAAALLCATVVVGPTRLPGCVDVVVGADVVLPVGPGAVAAFVVLGLPAASVVLGLVAGVVLPVGAAALLKTAVVVNPTRLSGCVGVVVGVDVVLPVGPDAAAAVVVL
jgi:hypothetical protein